MIWRNESNKKVVVLVVFDDPEVKNKWRIEPVFIWNFLIMKYFVSLPFPARQAVKLNQMFNVA